MNALSYGAKVLTFAVLCLIKAHMRTCYSASIKTACVFVLLRLQHATLNLACAVVPCCIAPCCIAIFHAIIINYVHAIWKSVDSYPPTRRVLLRVLQFTKVNMIELIRLEL